MKGFTIIELITSIGIIGGLTAILLPTIGRIRDTSRNMKCLSNLRELSIGETQGYHTLLARTDEEDWSNIRKCPKDKMYNERGTESYMLFNIPKNPEVYDTTKIKVVGDRERYHGWRNIGYYDTHSKREICQ